jgi:hypothetical protein
LHLELISIFSIFNVLLFLNGWKAIAH